MLGVYARYITGDAAADPNLLSVFSIGLLLGTLSLLVLAAVFFATAWVYSVTLRRERRYRALTLELRDSDGFLEELEHQENVRRAGDTGKNSALASPGGPKPGPVGFPGVRTPVPGAILDGKSASGGQQLGPSGRVDGEQALAASTGKDSPIRMGDPSGAATVGVMILIMILMLASMSTTACLQTSAATQESVEHLLEIHNCSDIEIDVDVSGSVVGLKDAWNNVVRQLPTILAEYACRTLTTKTFDVDGWLPRRIGDPLRMPPFRRPPLANRSSEFSDFKNFRDAADTHDRRLISEAQDQYRSQLFSALAPLAGLHILPSDDYNSSSSDVFGVFSRARSYRGTTTRLMIVITDLADSRYRVLPKIEPPTGDVRIVVALAPAKPRDAILTIGRALTGPEQYQLRESQLHTAAPWVSVVPYFEPDIKAAFQQLNRPIGQPPAQQIAAGDPLR